ncbi:glutamine synthetase family protein [Schaalia sp. lx-100]|uniref:glutamine synthetase family protein n=1 Tax=Schaalia sp. lx-100 TaxID=2899081 RepID=UPI001E5E1A44|nr:glutamine synthetase family protein [Schaalia sp. lx-100]MCD4557373.1 glutamine synthetase family protein [Schaalia sp. lx-100]
MDRQQERVLREVADQGIRFIRLWFTDVAGQLKSVAMDPGELEEAFTEGVGFDGSAIEGLTRVHESDMLLRPDASTFSVLPWQGNATPAARMFCDVLTPDGLQSRSDPRGTLERAVERARDMGFTVMVNPEIEFYLLSRPVTPERLVPIDDGGYFDHVARDGDNDFRRKLVLMLESMGISVQFSHHEGGPGQNEIDLRAVDAVTAADNIMTARVVIEEIALREDMVATFMPRPFIDHPGSGMHTHIFLMEGEHNAFYDPAGEHDLSLTARQFIAGMLAHAGTICAVTNQHVNSYKRLWGGGEAPSYVCWGHNNSSALIRVPQVRPSRRNTTRVEYRALDPAANPYLALAVLITAGLDGIEKQMELMPEAEDNVWALTDKERQVLGIEPLPSSLHDALRRMRTSELVADALGEEMFLYLLRDKEREWRDYREQITAKEIAQFIRMH